MRIVWGAASNDLVGELRQHLTDLEGNVRDLQEEARRLVRFKEEVEARQARRRARSDFLLTKLLPTMAGLLVAYAALASLFHWAT